MRTAALLVSLLTMLWTATAAEAESQRYLRASLDGAGQLRLVDSEQRTTIVSKQRDQVGFDQIRMAKGGRAVGWLALFPNCCTSYPIPLQLIVYANGRHFRFTGTGLPMAQWRFTDDGRHAVFEQETVHGGFGIHYEMRDIATGRLVEQWEPTYGSDNQVEPEQRPPTWVRDFNAAAGIAPWR